MKITGRVTIAFLLLTLAGVSFSAEATVIINRDCDYQLLDSSEGQILIKIIKGETPKQGDRLTGDFGPRDFAELTNSRTGETLQVWVDLVDRTTTKALMRFGQYCP